MIKSKHKNNKISGEGRKPQTYMPIRSSDTELHLPRFKFCSKCGKTKPLKDFYKNQIARDGRAPRCKECNYNYRKIRISHGVMTKHPKKKGKIRHQREIRFFNKMKREGIKLIYEPVRFYLSNHTKYTPDFYNPKTNTYYELAGTRQALHSNRKKVAKFQKEYPLIKLVIIKSYLTPNNDKLSPAKISKRSGIDWQVWQQNMDKNKIPSYQSVVRMARYLGCSIYDFPGVERQKLCKEKLIKYMKDNNENPWSLSLKWGINSHTMYWFPKIIILQKRRYFIHMKTLEKIEKELV